MLRGAPLRRSGESRFAFVTFLWGHLADDESTIDDGVVHLLLADSLLCFVALSP